MSGQAMTSAVAEQLDKCVGCGCDLDTVNTHELYLQRLGLCKECHEQSTAAAVSGGTALRAVGNVLPQVSVPVR